MNPATSGVSDDLLTAHTGFVRALALKLAPVPCLAEDIAQQVFAKVYFSMGNFDFRSSLLTWIYKITVNECYDYLRKKRVRKLVYESDFSEEESLLMQNSEAAMDHRPAVDTQLAQAQATLASS